MKYKKTKDKNESTKNIITRVSVLITNRETIAVKKAANAKFRKNMLGRQSLARHLGHSHKKINPVKREKIVIDKFYGANLVNSTIEKYKAGIYTNYDLPINIVRYIKLADIKKNEPNKKTPEKKEDKEQKRELVDENYTVAKVVLKDEEGEVVRSGYVYDIIQTNDDDLVFVVYPDIQLALQYTEIKEFLTTLDDWKDIKKLPVYVKFGRKLTEEDVIENLPYAIDIKHIDQKNIDAEHREKIIITVTD